MQGKNDIGFAVRRLYNSIKRDVEKDRSKLGIEHVKGVNGWAIGFFYDNREKDIFQRDFEEKFSIRRSTASRMLKTMEQKGFIERISVESDARLKKIVLTQKAIDNHRRIKESIKAREKRLRKGISQEEVDTFLKIIEKLTVNMEEDND